MVVARRSGLPASVIDRIFPGSFTESNYGELAVAHGNGRDRMVRETSIFLSKTFHLKLSSFSLQQLGDERPVGSRYPLGARHQRNVVPYPSRTAVLALCDVLGQRHYEINPHRQLGGAVQVPQMENAQRKSAMRRSHAVSLLNLSNRRLEKTLSIAGFLSA